MRASHMRGVVSSADLALAASATRFTAEECRVLRVAVGFGISTPQEREDSRVTLRSAVAKLRVIEKGGGQ